MSELDDFINRARYFDERGVEQDAGCNEAAAYELAELRAALDKAREALAEINRYNPIHNDLESYLFGLAEWGLDENEKRPDPKKYGL